MKGMQSLIRKKAGLLGIILMILFTAGTAAACGGPDQEAETKGAEQSGQKEVYTCELSVQCHTALESDKLDEGKRKILPSDGIMIAETQVEFKKGDTVYDILQREIKSRKIQMESAESPLYKSQYIEGIGNLYELDCGELSGWMYKVNDLFPRMGCSKYQVEQGDRIQWIYSCDQGKDIGGGNFQ